MTLKQTKLAGKVSKKKKKQWITSFHDLMQMHVSPFQPKQLQNGNVMPASETAEMNIDT